MAFNPDDFVFETIKPPEENPTILEYDPKLKLILLRTKNSNSLNDQFEYKSCLISEQVNNNLLENIPEKWHTRNDKMVLFYIRENGEYLLEREKLKYDVKTQTSKWFRYKYESFTPEDAKELFEILKSIIWIQNTVETESRDEQILELAKKEVYINGIHLKRLEFQTSLLRESDWRILEDTPSFYDNEKAMWIEWRRQLREIVKSPDEFEDELTYLLYNEEFKWPINPDQYHDLDPSHEVEYLSDDSHWTDYHDVSITNETVKIMNSQINESVARIREKAETGIPITRQMFSIVKRYNLLDNTTIQNIKFKEVNE